MADIITRLKFETDEFSNKARRMTTEINDITHKMEVAGNAVAHTNSRNLKLAQSFGTVQTASTTLRGKISELQDSFIAWSHHYNQLTEQQKREPYGQYIIQNLDLLRARIRQTKAEMQGLEDKMNYKVGSVAPVKSGPSFGQSFGKQFTQSFVPGIGMGAGAAVALKAAQMVSAAGQLAKDAIKYNIQTNMEFEQSNANLSAVLGITADKMVRLTEDAKKLGASTLFTANEITGLQTVLARLGFSQEQILNMTHGISNLALATGTDLSQSAELAGSTMRAFGMNATQMERIVSVLGVSTTKSALTTEKLGTALQYVAPTARAAGYSLEDTVAMLGKLVDSGLDASTAGTSLRQIILAMSTDNGKLARSFGRPVRGINDFIEALEHVSNAEDLLSDASKEVRVTAVPALISLANSRDGLKKLRDELDNVGGKLQDMADKQTQTLRGQVTLLKSAWDGLMLSFSESNGAMTKATAKLSEMLAAWTRWRNRNKGGESAVATYEKGADERGAKGIFNTYMNRYKDSVGADGKSNQFEMAANDIAGEIAKLRAKEEEAWEVYNKGGGRNGVYFEGFLKNKNAWKVEYGADPWKAMEQYIAKYRDKIATWEKSLGDINEQMSLRLQEENNNKVVTLSDKGPEKQAKDNVADALRRYQEALDLATEEYKNEVIDGQQFLQKKQSAQASVYKAYAEAYDTFADPAYKAGMEEWMAAFVETGGNLSYLNEQLKEMADKLREQLQADNQVARGFQTAIGKSNFDRISLYDNGELQARFNQMK